MNPKTTQVLDNMNEDEIPTLESCILTLGDINILSMSFLDRDFYELVKK
jgi:hypothetical protein